MVFAGYSPLQFDRGIELGAGDGHQSTGIKAYCGELVSTDLNENRLLKSDTSGIEYRICDAEEVDRHFQRNTFDLVYSSNMFEHLPHPEAALVSIWNILKPSGEVILIMPSVFWKCCHIGLFYPVAARGFIRRRLTHRRVRIAKSEPAPMAATGLDPGNNIKLDRGQRGWLSRMLRWPEPHGVSPGHLSELMAFRTARWAAMFEECGFVVKEIRPGPVTSGFGLGLDWVRKVLENAGVASEYIYYLAPRGK